MKLLPTLLLLASLAAQAQTNEVLPTINTELKRDSSAMMPYALINEVLTKLGQYGEGLFRMDFKVDTATTKIPLDSLRMAIASEDAYLPIKIGPDGAFELPVLPLAQAKTADLATNAAKGQVSVQGTLELTVPPEQLDMAKVRRIMRLSHKLKSELLPWYVRWLFPHIGGVVICADEPKYELEWREGGQLLGLPLPADEKDPRAKEGAKGRTCALLTGAERWPDSARLVSPPNTQLSIKLGN